jgi:hypothetical protein
MKHLRSILADLPPSHRTALEWFFAQAGKDVPWTPYLDINGDRIQLVTKAKAFISRLDHRTR